MDLKGSKTEQNLWTAFAGESQARNKYTYYASKAKKEGYNQIAAIFEETAGQRKRACKIWFKLLHDGNARHRRQTWWTPPPASTTSGRTCMPALPKRRKKRDSIASRSCLKPWAKSKKEHEERYRKLLSNLENGLVFAREEVQVWQCANCGHIHIGKKGIGKVPGVRSSAGVLRHQSRKLLIDTQVIEKSAVPHSAFSFGRISMPLAAAGRLREHDARRPPCIGAPCPLERPSELKRETRNSRTNTCPKVQLAWRIHRMALGGLCQMHAPMETGRLNTRSGGLFFERHGPRASMATAMDIRHRKKSSYP